MQAVFEKHVQASLAVVPSKLRLVLQLKADGQNKIHITFTFYGMITVHLECTENGLWTNECVRTSKIQYRFQRNLFSATTRESHLSLEAFIGCFAATVWAIESTKISKCAFLCGTLVCAFLADPSSVAGTAS